MRITVVAIGTRMPDWINRGCDEYTRRFPRELALTIVEVPPVKRRKSIAHGKLLTMEAQRIEAALPRGARRIALDEQGRDFNTRDLSNRLNHWMTDGQDLAFIIGGADGLDPVLLADVDEVWSLSRLTLPHGLARVVLVEQLYRVWSLLQGHPYHRE